LSSRDFKIISKNKSEIKSIKPAVVQGFPGKGTPNPRPVPAPNKPLPVKKLSNLTGWRGFDVETVRCRLFRRIAYQ
jgi:hypothetical protein